MTTCHVCSTVAATETMLLSKVGNLWVKKVPVFAFRICEPCFKNITANVLAAFAPASGPAHPPILEEK